MSRNRLGKALYCVSSAAIQSTSFKGLDSTKVISSRLPIGVATRFLQLAVGRDCPIKLFESAYPTPCITTRHRTIHSSALDVVHKIITYVKTIFINSTDTFANMFGLDRSVCFHLTQAFAVYFQTSCIFLFYRALEIFLNNFHIGPRLLVTFGKNRPARQQPFLSLKQPFPFFIIHFSLYFFQDQIFYGILKADISLPHFSSF